MLAEGWAGHSKAAYAFFRRMGAGPQDAADLAQETLLRALRGAGRFRGDSSVRTWVLGIARLVFQEHQRRRRRRPETILDSVADRAAGAPAASEWIEVQQALASLEPADREVLLMRFAYDMSGEEAAALLGISHEALRQRVSRARAAFRDAWGKA